MARSFLWMISLICRGKSTFLSDERDYTRLWSAQKNNEIHIHSTMLWVDRDTYISVGCEYFLHLPAIFWYIQTNGKECGQEHRLNNSKLGVFCTLYTGIFHSTVEMRTFFLMTKCVSCLYLLFSILIWILIIIAFFLLF